MTALFLFAPVAAVFSIRGYVLARRRGRADDYAAGTWWTR